MAAAEREKVLICVAIACDKLSSNEESYEDDDKSFLNGTKIPPTSTPPKKRRVIIFLRTVNQPIANR